MLWERRKALYKNQSVQLSALRHADMVATTKIRYNKLELIIPAC